MTSAGGRRMLRLVRVRFSIGLRVDRGYYEKSETDIPLIIHDKIDNGEIGRIVSGSNL